MGYEDFLTGVRPIQSDGAIAYVLNLTLSYTLLPPTRPHCNPGFQDCQDRYGIALRQDKILFRVAVNLE